MAHDQPFDAARLRRAFHEAAHAEVARDVGITVEAVTIVGDETFAGSCRLREWLDVAPPTPGADEDCLVRPATDSAEEWFSALPEDDIEEVIERQVCVLLAGEAGERLFESDQGLRPQGVFHAAADSRLIAAHLGCLDPGDDEAQRARHASQRTLAHEITVRRREKVARLAGQLYRAGTVE